MICDLCGKEKANVHLTEIIDDQSRELHLCEACAREKGASAAQDFGLADLLAGLTDFGTKMEGKEAKTISCPKCGLTYESFRKTGRLGCGGCYETFRRYLAPLLKRIHGSTQHVGRVPAATVSKKVSKPEDPLIEIKEKLKSAVAAEAFEEAAQLRDQIRTLEGKSKRNTRGKKSK